MTPPDRKQAAAFSISLRFQRSLHIAFCASPWLDSRFDPSRLLDEGYRPPPPKFALPSRPHFLPPPYQPQQLQQECRQAFAPLTATHRILAAGHCRWAHQSLAAGYERRLRQLSVQPCPLRRQILDSRVLRHRSRRLGCRRAFCVHWSLYFVLNTQRLQHRGRGCITGQSDSEPIKPATQLMYVSDSVEAREYTRPTLVEQTHPVEAPSNIGSPVADHCQGNRRSHQIACSAR